MLERTGCSFLPACFSKTKKPKFNTEAYDSSLCYSFALLMPAHGLIPFLYVQPLSTVCTIPSAQGLNISTVEPAGLFCVYVHFY